MPKPRGDKTGKSKKSSSSKSKSSSSKTKSKSKVQFQEPVDDIFEDGQEGELEAEPEPARKGARTKIELEPESPDEEEGFSHVCGECGKEIECPDGKLSKDGKKFKCSCPKEKEGRDTFYFCSRECLEADPSEEEDGEDDWDEVEVQETE